MARSASAYARIAMAVLAATVVLMALDLVWLGIIMKPHYDAWLGTLRNDAVVWPAALAFYVLYMSWIVRTAITTETVQQAAKAGAQIGFYAYGVYELTNAAVIRDWPVAMILPDWAWGIVLTATVCATAKWTLIRTAPSSSR